MNLIKKTAQILQLTVLPFSFFMAQGTIAFDTPFPPICSSLQSNIRFGDTDLSTQGGVTTLQNFLFDEGYYPRKGVGEFGQMTQSSLAKYQKATNLPSTGFFGPMTRHLINDKYCNTAGMKTIPSVIDTTSEQNGTSTSGQVLGLGTTTLAVSDPKLAIMPNNSGYATSSNLTLPYNNAFDYFKNWYADWGEATTTAKGSLLMQATASTTGAEALLAGSENWTDYSFTAGVVVNINGSYSLLVRYTDGNNYLDCTFSGNNIYINKHVGGKKTTVASVWLEMPSVISSTFIGTNVTAKVKGDNIICSEDANDDVTYAISDASLKKGGVGVSIWHSVPGVTSLDLLSVNVVPL